MIMAPDVMSWQRCWCQELNKIMLVKPIKKKKKDFSPLGVNFHFKGNYMNKFCFVHQHGGNANHLC